MKKKLLFLLVLMVAVLVLVTSCSEDKTTEPETRQVATPTFNPPGGTYTGGQQVTINCKTEGATIRYTTNGTNPTSSSTVYGNSLSVTSDTIIKAKGFRSGWNDSDVATAQYTISQTQTVATPSFNPSGGSFNSPVNVHISCTTQGATIRYTTDNTEPTQSSNSYTGPLYVSSTRTIKAKAFRSGWNNSSTVTQRYDIVDESTVATPIFSPVGSSYNTPQNITIDCSTSGATIHYTTNNSTPTQASPTYSNPINISETTTLKARAYKNGMNDSQLAQAHYTMIAAQPVFNPPGGSYSTSQNVRINCDTPGVTIRYTTNGNSPTQSSSVYSGPIEISSTTTLKAVAFREGWTSSSMATAEYSIGSLTISNAYFEGASNKDYDSDGFCSFRRLITTVGGHGSERVKFGLYYSLAGQNSYSRYYQSDLFIYPTHDTFFVNINHHTNPILNRNRYDFKVRLYNEDNQLYDETSLSEYPGLANVAIEAPYEDVASFVHNLGMSDKVDNDNDGYYSYANLTGEISFNTGDLDARVIVYRRISGTNDQWVQHTLTTIDSPWSPVQLRIPITGLQRNSYDFKIECELVNYPNNHLRLTGNNIVYDIRFEPNNEDM